MGNFFALLLWCLWFCLMLWTENAVDKADGACGLTDRQAGGASVFAPAVCELSSSCLSVLSTLDAFSARIACSLGTNVPEGREDGLAGWLSFQAHLWASTLHGILPRPWTAEPHRLSPLPRNCRHPPAMALPGGQSHVIMGYFVFNCSVGT